MPPASCSFRRDSLSSANPRRRVRSRYFSARATALVLLCAACPSDWAAGESRPGSVRGWVVDARSGEFLSGAALYLVEISRQAVARTGPDAVELQARSREFGSFELPAVPSGEYEIRAELPGYLPAGSGRDSPTVAVVPGHGSGGIMIPLWPESVIQGKVVDSRLAGVGNVSIGAFLEANARLVQVGIGTTDLSGGFSIGRLPPGRYILVAVPSGPPGPPTYYPSSPSLGGAVPILVAEAELLVGVTVTLSGEKVNSVRGTVEGVLEGSNARGAAVHLAPRSTSGLALAALAWKTPLDSKQVFQFDGIPSGTYTLQLNGGPPDHRILSTQILVVGPSGAEGVKIRADAPLALQGRVQLAGIVRSDLSSVRIALQSTPPATGISTFVEAQVEPDGGFTVEGLEPTVYVLHVQAPSDLFVERVRFAGNSITGLALDLTHGSKGTLEIKLRDGAARLSGAVLTADVPELREMAECVAILSRADSNAGVLHRRVSSVREGRFEFAGIAPGLYNVVVTERFDPALFGEPTFLAVIAGKLHKTILRRRDHKRVELQLLDAAEIEAAAWRSGLAAL